MTRNELIAGWVVTIGCWTLAGILIYWMVGWHDIIWDRSTPEHIAMPLILKTVLSMIGTGILFGIGTAMLVEMYKTPTYYEY